MRCAHYIRLSFGAPGFVIPVFSNEETYFVERRDRQHSSELIELNPDYAKRILSLSQPFDAELSKTGEHFIGYEYPPGKVYFGALEAVEKYIREIIKDDTIFANRPFARLEAAQAVGDDAILREASIQCFLKLKKLANHTADSWLRNSDSEIQQAVRFLQIVDENATSSSAKPVRAAIPAMISNLIKDRSQRLGISRGDYIDWCIQECLEKSELITLRDEQNIKLGSFDEYMRLAVKSSTLAQYNSSKFKLIGLSLNKLMYSDNILSKSTTVDAISNLSLHEVRRHFIIDVEKLLILKRNINVRGASSERATGIVLAFALLYGDPEFKYFLHSNIIEAIKHMDKLYAALSNDDA